MVRTFGIYLSREAEITCSAESSCLGRCGKQQSHSRFTNKRTYDGAYLGWGPDTHSHPCNKQPSLHLDKLQMSCGIHYASVSEGTSTPSLLALCALKGMHHRVIHRQRRK